MISRLEIQIENQDTGHERQQKNKYCLCLSHAHPYFQSKISFMSECSRLLMALISPGKSEGIKATNRGTLEVFFFFRNHGLWQQCQVHTTHQDHQ